ncbi:pilus assembly protein PilP [Halomonas sp. TRM85114]|uniref:pilus assembly protein PilP n=1 Tax=Halomonas jincaotanensis TaxID=2810616 RepID=UPI001BD2B517|nr:pilus assembly protein PilP [Halomonas jincaotanensis]MBS9403160.1 pilus assembly protein PilP [Halomonas jincaotanensis]
MSATGKRWLFAGVLGLLGGCSDPQLGSLDRELTAIRNDPGKVPKVVLPEIPDYETVAYTLADQRSPFLARSRQDGGPTPHDSDLAPNPDRPKDVLEAYALSELELVGTLTVEGRPSALVRAPNGQVHRLTTGQYMGQDNGRIVTITEASVGLVETVLDQNTWVERNHTLKLEE